MRIRKGIISKVDGSDKKLQTCQVEGVADEVINNVERFQNYGFSSYPLDATTDEASEVIIADLPSGTVICATDDRRLRPLKSLPGDVVIYGSKDDPENEGGTHRITLTDWGDEQFSVINITASDVTGASFQKYDGYNQQVSIYSGDNTILINKNDDSITINANGKTILVNSSGISITGNVTITGNLTVSGTVTNAGKNIGKTHTHGGVSTGAGTTGVVS